jgi:hypothetical protein
MLPFVVFPRATVCAPCGDDVEIGCAADWQDTARNITGSMMNRYTDLLRRVSPEPNEVAFLHEASNRLDDAIEQHFGGTVAQINVLFSPTMRSSNSRTAASRLRSSAGTGTRSISADSYFRALPVASHLPHRPVPLLTARLGAAPIRTQHDSHFQPISPILDAELPFGTGKLQWIRLNAIALQPPRPDF